MMSSLISKPFAAHPSKLESTWAANASCTSITPRSFHAMPARSPPFRTPHTRPCTNCHPAPTAAPLQQLPAGIDGGDGVGPDERERLVSQRARRVFAHQQDG